MLHGWFVKREQILTDAIKRVVGESNRVLDKYTKCLGVYSTSEKYEERLYAFSIRF